MVIGSYGVIRNNPNTWDYGLLGGISFIGNDGTIYGPYGGTEGDGWESNIPSSVSYISGRSGSLVDAITFHHCSKNQGRYLGTNISGGVYKKCNFEYESVILRPFLTIIEILIMIINIKLLQQGLNPQPLIPSHT